ncbi:MAG: YraN family protein [Cryomorphaceae bacterium]|jgi:putative endonuclease|nr:YraN family protein [Cryomorphaceae bacterium]
MNTVEIGRLGEELAEKFLNSKGVQITARNVRYKKFEIDLISETTEEVIVYEVKLRHTRKLGEPWRAVTRTKQRQIITVADHFQKQRNSIKNVRFDIISIIHNEFETDIEHIQYAFAP